MLRVVPASSRIVALCFLLLARPGFAADEAGRAIDEMKPQLLEETGELEKHIRGNDVPAALESVQLIDAWLRQAQAQSVTAVFLDVPGWEKELGEAQAVGQAMFGGAVTASCTYTQADKVVTVDIVGNSPMLAMISGMMGMAVMSGKKVVKIHGSKALVDDSGNRVEIQVPFEGSALVTGRGPDQESTVHVTENGVSWDALAAAMQK